MRTAAVSDETLIDVNAVLAGAVILEASLADADVTTWHILAVGGLCRTDVRMQTFIHILTERTVKSITGRTLAFVATGSVDTSLLRTA